MKPAAISSMTIRGVLLLSALCVPSACASKALRELSGDPQYSNYRKEAQSLLDESFPEEGPGAVAIVTQGRETIFLGARGYSRLETSERIQDDTIFRLGSITKQMTAATVMLLVEEGRLALDQPIGNHLKGYPDPGASVSLRQVLNHTSGMPSYTDNVELLLEPSSSHARSTAEMLALFEDWPMDFEPGSEWRYSNSGYVVLGALIESVTGQPWAEVVQVRISEPLGLSSLQEDRGVVPLELMATGYTGQDPFEKAQAMHPSFPHAAGALVANVKDLASWAYALHHDGILSQLSYLEMVAPTRLNDGTIQNYGFGLFVRADSDGRPTIGHSGGIFGFSTDSIYYPDEDVFIAILVNSDEPSSDPSVVMRGLAELFFRAE